MVTEPWMLYWLLIPFIVYRCFKYIVTIVRTDAINILLLWWELTTAIKRVENSNRHVRDMKIDLSWIIFIFYIHAMQTFTAAPILLEVPHSLTWHWFTKNGMCVILSLLNVTVCQVTPLAFVVNAINRVNFGFGFEQIEQNALLGIGNQYGIKPLIGGNKAVTEPRAKVEAL